MSTFQNFYVDNNTYTINFDQFKGSQSPPKKILSKSGGVDRCSTPPFKIQWGCNHPNPPPPCLAPLDRKFNH